jgi:hypothetical protein
MIKLCPCPTVQMYNCYNLFFNPILHTAWLNNHALTLKRNTAKYYFGEKSSCLHTFLKICCESRKLAMSRLKYQVYLYGSEAITYLNAFLWVATEPAL